MLTVAFEQLDSTTQDAAPTAPGEIPQSDANPMLAELNRPALEREQQEAKALSQWREEARQQIDDYALGFDSFAPDKEEWVRQRALVSQFLHVETDQEPGEGLAYDMLRDQYADAMFEGRGKGSDAAFFGELQKSAQGRKDSKALDSDLDSFAGRSSVVKSVASRGDDPLSFAAWREQAKRKPGYDLKREADYLERWESRRTAALEAIEEFRIPLTNVWNGGFRQGGNGLEFDAYRQLTPEQRPRFIYALSQLAQTLPKEEQATFWGNLTKSNSRAIGGFVRDAAVGTQADVMKGGTVGWEDFIGSNEAVAAKNARDSQAYDDFRTRNDFFADIRRVREGTYDPVRFLTKEGSAAHIAESAAYSAPSAIFTSAATLVPYVGQAAFYESSKESIYQDYRQQFQDAGMSYEKAREQAETLAPIAAVPQVLAERLQAQAIMGKLPLFEKVLAGAANQIKSRALRFAARTAAGSVEQGLLEQGQDYLPDLVQDMAHALKMDVPDVEWNNGKDGVLDGFWTDSATMVLTMLPLSLIGATGGLSRDSRNQAFAKASDTELLALGVPADNLAEIRSGQAKGDHSLGIAVDQALATLDPRSDSAKTATQELAESQQAAQQTAREADRSGAIPRFQRTAEGWTVFDGETNEEVGTAPDASGAFRLAKVHSEAVENMEGDRVAYLATMLEAGDLQSARDGEGRKTTTDFNLGDTVTATQQAAHSEQDAARIAAQVYAKEKLNGGDGSLAQVVFGQSRTEIEQKQRRTLNRLNAGASVLTVFHEEAHGFYREALSTGRLTREDTVAAIRAVETVLEGRTTRDGQALRFLPENDADITDTALDEAVAELMEAEILRNRKTGGRRQIPAGIISRNLSAIARLAPGAAEKFSNFLRAVRSYFGLAFSRAVAIKQGIREGKIDEAKLDELTTKLLGLNEQDEHDQSIAREAADILGTHYGEETGEAVPEGDPFSLGNGDIPSIINAHLHERHLIPGAGEPSPSEGSLEEASRRGLEQALFGAESRVGERDIARGSESIVVSFAPGRVLKRILSTGIARYTRSGGYSFDRSFEAAAEKAHVINALGGMATSAFATEDGSVFLIQDEGSPITESEFESLRLPFNIVPSTGNVFRVEIDGRHFLISDLHRENFVKDEGGNIRLIDLVTGQVEANTSPLPTVNDSSLSLGPAAIADAIRGDALARIKNPLRRAQAMERISRKAEGLRLQFERLELLAGSKRLAKSLRKEAAMREATRAQELENEAYARHWGILSNDDLTRIKSQPAHAALADPKSPLRGRLMSKAAAIKKHPDLFQLHRPGDYDGSDGLSRSIFGGTLMPDQAAQELYESGLIQSPTTDALWDKLRAEQEMVAGMKDLQAKALEDVRNARKQAKAETNAWLAEQTKNQTANYSPKEEILRTLAMLDGILAVLPPHIRGEIGGYTQIARIGNDVNRLAFLRDKLDLADKKLESWLRVQYAKEMEALLKRAKPDKDEEGHKPRGKIGSDLHDLFRSLESAMSLSAGEVEAEAVKLESLVESGEYTADQESHMTLEANLLRLVGDWEHADAARREAALLEATRVFESGYFEHRREVSAKRERRAKQRDVLQEATGKQGERMERVARAVKDSTKAGRLKQAALSLFSFEQIVQTAFGENTAEANRLVDWERKASASKEDAIDSKTSAIEDLFADLAGGKYKGEQLRWKMSQPAAVSFKDWKGREQTFSELEAITATLMWRQEDGRRHMEGHVSDDGKPVGDWHWREQDVADLEDQLSPEAKAARLHLAEQYGSEYDRLNAVYRDLYGVSLPRHKHYSPLTVKPVKTQGGQMLDPVTGATMSGSAFSPGSLKTRSQTAVAEPDFRDALQTYLAHTKQMEHFIAYAPFATESMALINARDVGNAIEAAGGKETLSVLRSWLDHFAQGGTRDAGAHLGWNKLSNRINSRLASAALAGRVSVLAVQSVQLGAALAEMPTGSYLTRFAKLMTGQLGWRDALRSDYIQRRLSQMPPVVRQAMEGFNTTRPTRLKFAAQKMGQLINGADALFTAGTYAIIYDYQLKKGLTPAEAHSTAERITDRVAQPTRAATRSLYENTATHPATRLMWAFASEARQKLALSAYAVSKKPAGAKLRALAVTWGMGGVVATLIRAALRDLRDDEDDEWFDERNWDPARLAIASLTGPIQGIPMLGDAIESAIFTGFGEYQASGTWLNNLAVGVKGALKIPDWFSGEREFEDALKDVEALLGGLAIFSGNASAGTSFMHVARDLYGIASNIEGTD